MSPRTAVARGPDLEAGLRRLKLAAVRRMAPEVLKTAKVQRWPPEELLPRSWKPRSPPVMPRTNEPGARPRASP